MPVNLKPPRAEDLLPIAGVRIGVAEAAIRKPGRKDVTVFVLDENTHVAGVFTQNRFCAAPVQVCRAHLLHREKDAAIRALVINTGNANAGTGAVGLAHARQTCAALAALLQLDATQVLPFSTGVIMEALPVQRLIDALPQALEDAGLRDANGTQWAQAAAAIMTTDTVPKAVSTRVEIGGKTVSITGIAKGSGMIAPNMATMLGFIATDCAIAQPLMQPLLRQLAEESFHRVSVDGDTSTNDSLLLLASHRAGNAPVAGLHGADGQALYGALRHVAQWLAQALVRDGEGAGKLVTIHVEGGKNAAECRAVARAIAHSPLVKTAFFASDPNLGRILAAVGYAGIDDLDAEKIDLYLDNVHVAAGGARHPGYREADGARVMQQGEFAVRVCLGRGLAQDTLWTCDLGHEYVRINAEYRS